MIKAITARELQEKISEKELHLPGVRERVEYVVGHVPTAANLLLNEFVSNYQTPDKDKVYRIICQSGSRSEQTTIFLSQQDYQVVNVVDSTSAWTGTLEY